MPTPIQNNAVILVTYQGRMNNQTILNTQHFQYRLVGGNPDYDAEMDDLLGQLADPGSVLEQILAATHSSFQMVYMMAQPVYPVRLAKVTTTQNAPGIRTGTPLPQNVAAVCTRSGDFGTRWNRGNWHQAGLLTTDASNGTWSLAAMLLLQNIAVELTDPITLTSGAVCQPGLWSPKVPTRFTEVTRAGVQSEVRVMRRRTVGQGI